MRRGHRERREGKLVLVARGGDRALAAVASQGQLHWGLI